MIRTVSAQVLSGKGRGHAHVAAGHGEFLKARFGMDVFPGTLGVKFTSPFYLADGAVEMRSRRFVAIKINGAPAILKKSIRERPYNGQVYAPIRLRDQFALQDGDTVTIEIEDRDFVPLTLVDRIIVALRSSRHLRFFRAAYHATRVHLTRP
jgi:CTP-dependent riboflavin kinase